MSNRWLGSADVPRGDVYDARFTALAQTGQDVHGEAHFCRGTRGIVRARRRVWYGQSGSRAGTPWDRRRGVDLDPTMLAVARRKAPHLAWYEGDLATVELARPEMPEQRYLFDAIVLAGNVMIFLAPGSEATAVANLARHLTPGGALVAGLSAPPRRSHAGALRRVRSSGQA